MQITLNIPDFYRSRALETVKVFIISSKYSLLDAIIFKAVIPASMLE